MFVNDDREREIEIENKEWVRTVREGEGAQGGNFLKALFFISKNS